VDALRARGDEVTVLELAGEPHRDDIEWLQTDICDAEAVRRGCVGADVVFHNASLVHTKANRGELVWAVNLGGTENVLAACLSEGVGRLVYVSSASAVYEGRDIENGDETLPYARVSQAAYADSKIAAEKLVLAAGQDGLRTIAIRPHVVFGPGDTRFLPALLDKAKAGQLRVSVGWGTWLSDFTYIDNLIDGPLAADQSLAGSADNSGRAYFITNGEPTAFWDFVRAFVDKMGFPPIVAAVPYPLAYAVAAAAEAWDTLKGGTLNTENGLSRFAVRYMCTHHYFSVERAKRELGWTPAVSLAEGIDRTVAHLQRTA
jgi:2-alkyl-3-oxoalkanoate reductase